MKNMNELRSHLSCVFEDLKAGETKASDAKELANIAGKMINSSRAQLVYYALRKESPSIEFLDEPA